MGVEGMKHMTTKVCFKCQKDKPLSDFYGHPQMHDKHLGKCKDCTRKDTADRVARLLANNPEWAKKEQARHRAKAARYALEYPEKQKAHDELPGSTCDGSKHRHHWSYRKEHFLDVINLSPADHRHVHRYMVYDKERMQYRRLDGVLMDTREAAEKYYAEILLR